MSAIAICVNDVAAPHIEHGFCACSVERFWNRDGRCRMRIWRLPDWRSWESSLLPNFRFAEWYGLRSSQTLPDVRPISGGRQCWLCPRLNCPHKCHETETKLKQKVSKLFCFSQNKTPRPWNVLAVLANHCWYTLFARQTRGGGGAMTYAWRSRSQWWAVALLYAF